MVKINKQVEAPVDDQLFSENNVLFHIFYHDKEFIYKQWTNETTSLDILGKSLTLVDDQFFYDNQLIDSDQLFNIVETTQLKVLMTSKPKIEFDISSKEKSGITLPMSGLVTLRFNNKTNGYDAQIFSDKDTIYIDGKLQENGETKLCVGSRLVINNLIIDIREKQLKLISLDGQFKLNPWVIVEEDYVSEYPSEFPSFKRSPRIHLKEPEEKIEIVTPKPKEVSGKNELLRTIVPPLGMVVLSGATSFLSGGNPIMMISMGGASLLTAGFSVSSYFTNKKEAKIKNKEREVNYSHYLIKEKDRLERLKQEQEESLHYMFPSIENLSLMTKNYDPRIYERMRTNEDFLKLSLGTGEIPTTFDTSFNFNEEDDLVKQAEKHLVWPYETLSAAPIVVPILNQTLGLAGHYPILRTAVQTMLFQLAVLHSYRDVEFVSLVPEEDYENNWAPWRWLPHFKIRSLNLRGIIHSAQTRDMVLNSFYQILTKRRQEVREAGSEKINFSPHYVFSILDESWLAGHGLNEFLAEDMSQYGVTVIWGKDALNMLPETTTTLIQYQSNEVATLINQDNNYVNQLFVPNRLPMTFTVDEAIQRLANLDHVEVEKNAIPEAIDFLELYNIKSTDELGIEARWQKADTSKSLAVPLGVRGKDDIVYLNLHERAHGPHGLVAGTTGSGKSEIVQSYILSLAVNFAPEDVGFLPIDFKGGGMANLFEKLPHLLGSITNLDGASSARALQSIRAELQKRQRKFGEYGVNHINGYTKLYKQGKKITDPEEKKKYPSSPIPHLFLISDEFAELKANEPDFMAELVSTARIGRSLGVHLILATQKPSGVVDDQIWSNSRFKLALKVADTNDSNEIIKTPDAAAITQPGRAYLQVGNNEIYELFQSAWSGANYTPFASKEERIDERIWLINQLGQYELLTEDLSEEEDVVIKTEEEKTQLDAVVEAIAEFSKAESSVLPDKPWLPPLETSIVSPVTSNQWQEAKKLAVPFGFMDIPTQQSQVNFDFNLQDLSHTAIYGSPGFGKSTLLQTLVMNFARLNTPEQVQFNLFDFGTNGLLPLKDLPHVVDIVKLEEEEKLIKFLKRIRKEIQDRKDSFTEYGVASLAQFEEKSGTNLPVIITVMDVYDSVKENPLEESIDSVMNQMLREGASVGIYLIVTALRTTSFKMSMASNLPSHIGLFLVEEGAIRDVVGREALIAQEIIGRAQIKLDQVQEVQVYLPIDGENDIDRLNKMEAEIEKMEQEWTGDRPDAIPMLPKVISMVEFLERKETKAMLERMEVPIALDKETTKVVGFNPKEHGYFVIGADTPQQTEYIEKMIIESFKHFAGKARRIVFNASERFDSFVESFDTFVSDFDYGTVINDLVSEINTRQVEAENELIFVYVPDANAFGDKTFISNEAIDTIFRKAQKVNVYFIFEGNQKQIENSYDDFNKRLRNNIPAGMIGTRLADQNLVNVKSTYSEPAVGTDEGHMFIGRVAGRVKLVSE